MDLPDVLVKVAPLAVELPGADFIQPENWQLWFGCLVSSVRFPQRTTLLSIRY